MSKPKDIERQFNPTSKLFSSPFQAGNLAVASDLSFLRILLTSKVANPKRRPTHSSLKLLESIFSAASTDVRLADF